MRIAKCLKLTYMYLWYVYLVHFKAQINEFVWVMHGYLILQYPNERVVSLSLIKS